MRFADLKPILPFTVITLGAACVLPLASRGVDPRGAMGAVVAILGMWLPGLVAMGLKLAQDRSLRGIGWKAGPWRFWGIGYLAPLVYGGLAFAIAALVGAGGFDFTRWVNGARDWGLAPLAVNGLLIQMTVLVLPGMIMAFGEEIGWRGYLVPKLAERLSFTAMVNTSAVIWFAFHLPGILGGQYGPADLPLAWKLAMFAGVIWSASLFYAWLRLRSGSVWPVVVAHGAHNTFIQMMFASGFAWTAQTPWIAGEFGIATVALMVVTALAVGWRGRQVTGAAQPRAALA